MTPLMPWSHIDERECTGARNVCRWVAEVVCRPGGGHLDSERSPNGGLCHDHNPSPYYVPCLDLAPCHDLWT